MDSTMVAVTPEDREAAAKWLRSVHSIYLAQWIEGTGAAPEWAESPNPEDYSLVQTLARHRIQSEGRTGAGEALEVRAEIERLFKVYSHNQAMNVCGGHANGQMILDCFIDDLVSLIEPQSTAGEDGA